MPCGCRPIVKPLIPKKPSAEEQVSGLTTQTAQAQPRYHEHR
jgi:hypothetical protein